MLSEHNLPLNVRSTNSHWTCALVSALLSTQLPLGTAPKTRTVSVHYTLGTQQIIAIMIIKNLNLAPSCQVLLYLLCTLCRIAKWSSKSRRDSLMFHQSQTHTWIQVWCSGLSAWFPVLNTAWIWIPCLEWKNSLRFWNRRSWDLPPVSWERFLSLVLLIIKSDEIITFS